MDHTGAGLHEAAEQLSSDAIDMHRALASLVEELEAVDWYPQRAAACSDDALRAILLHNAREEKEHACMALEWIRRHDAEWDTMLRRILFDSGPIAEHGESAGGAHDGERRRSGSLAIGDLRGPIGDGGL